MYSTTELREDLLNFCCSQVLPYLSFFLSSIMEYPQPSFSIFQCWFNFTSIHIFTQHNQPTQSHSYINTTSTSQLFFELSVSLQSSSTMAGVFSSVCGFFTKAASKVASMVKAIDVQGGRTLEVGQITKKQEFFGVALFSVLFLMWGLAYGLLDIMNYHVKVTLGMSSRFLPCFFFLPQSANISQVHHELMRQNSRWPITWPTSRFLSSPAQSSDDLGTVQQPWSVSRSWLSVINLWAWAPRNSRSHSCAALTSLSVLV